MTKEDILNLLHGSSTYLSGQKISEQLGISRAAVWKQIKILQDEGYQIEAVRNKGYYLTSSPDKLTVMEVSHLLKTDFIGKELKCYEQIDSTNLEIKRLAEAGAKEGTLVIADAQQTGRGRRGRVWDSPAGTGLFMSLLLRPTFVPSKASMLTLLLAMAVMRGIREVTGIQTEIKWPNDLVYQGKKICGILTEMGLEEDRINYVVAGIGINVNTKEFPSELQDKATSLLEISKKSVRRAELAAQIWKDFEPLYYKFMQEGSLSFIINEYNQYLVNRHQEIYLIEKEGRRQVRQDGLSFDGGLEVINEMNQKEIIYSGEISIRGVYGYV